jgi:hypothetical protein|tara:strand:- start:2695 stop:3228 length:534 start_codon:yes stop_codon:yes gene_type:complete
MFGDFSIEKFKRTSYPKDFSLKTLDEIKSLKLIPIDADYANKYDNLTRVFKSLFEKRKRNYPKKIVEDLVENSHDVIMKIKVYHNRPRPNVLAKKLNINLPYHHLDSAQTPAFPSGHSAQAKLVSLVLSDMYPEMQNEFNKLSDHISQSRIVARVHYKSDKIIGEKLGESLYNHLNK